MLLTTRKAFHEAKNKKLLKNKDFKSKLSSCSIEPSWISKNVIGSGTHVFSGPFGTKPIIYADTTASGKSLEFVEKYIRKVVLPLYANTHTEASITGMQTSHFRNQARNLIHHALNAPNDEYAVIFTGSGVTAAIDKFSRMLGFHQSHFKEYEQNEDQPIVFIGPYEHHSNEILWRETQAKVVKIQIDPKNGSIDHRDLERRLIAFAGHKIKIGSFSAASNVTGIRSDTKLLSQLLHKHGALACFDFASAGPHEVINVSRDNIDVAFLSVHKFVGGPQTPGLLVLRRSVYADLIGDGPPTVPSGGTVGFVQPTDGQTYLSSIEDREEGGTPAIIESIRAGLVLTVHSKIGHKIEDIENGYLQQALASWSSNPNLIVVGNLQAKRVPIISFLVKAPSGNSKYLHHDFVTVLLNDLFGIQARGGCACAGPYSFHLLNIDPSKASELEELYHLHGSIIKMGYTRVAFSYYMEKETVDYIVEAVNIIAKEGHKLLPWYMINSVDGKWSHVDSKHRNTAKLDLSGLEAMETSYIKPKKARKNYKKCLRDAKKVLNEISDFSPSTEVSTVKTLLTEENRWFLLPDDTAALSEKQ